MVFSILLLLLFLVLFIFYVTLYLLLLSSINLVISVTMLSTNYEFIVNIILTLRIMFFVNKIEFITILEYLKYYNPEFLQGLITN